MKYYLHVIKNYAVFSGRARRSEYWYFVLFNILFSILAAILDNLIGSTFSITSTITGEPTSLYYGYIYLLYFLFCIVPSISVGVRRLHDTGRSGWWYFICLVPFVGEVVLLVFFFMDSIPGENQFGPNPKGIGNHDDIEAIGSHLQPQ
ncbi:MAG: DUF805 domain-containing protein [Bacteroidota bacterium]|nr:DUF805 domain-containing protein [Bacteroidota bacterium]